MPSRPDCDNLNWHPAVDLEQREARTYSWLSPYQGRDIPLCYGFYLFELPHGEQCIGTVLEDLSKVSVPLQEHLVSMGARQQLDLTALDRLVVAALEVQHRTHEQDISQAVFLLSDLRLLRTNAPLHPLIIAVGFSRTHTKYTVVEGDRLINAELRATYNRDFPDVEEDKRYACE